MSMQFEQMWESEQQEDNFWSKLWEKVRSVVKAIKMIMANIATQAYNALTTRMLTEDQLLQNDCLENILAQLIDNKVAISQNDIITITPTRNADDKEWQFILHDTSVVKAKMLFVELNDEGSTTASTYNLHVKYSEINKWRLITPKSCKLHVKITGKNVTTHSIREAKGITNALMANLETKYYLYTDH